LYNYFEDRRVLDIDGKFGPQTDLRVSKYRQTINDIVQTYQIPGPAKYRDRTVNNFQGLNPRFLTAFLTASGNLDLEGFAVIEGLRSYSEQNKLYAQGRETKGKIVTNAKAGYSMHNFGEALDFGLFGPSGLYITDNRRYDAVAQAIQKNLTGYQLEFGYQWKFKDSPHIQWDASTRDIREKFRLLTK
jgi:peptidoglycan L-alanyl-D-glutamate endopeptidase CwlK